MSKLVSRIAGFFNRRNLVGSDKGGNRYFARAEEIDGVVKEKRWVIFKGEEDPTSVPVEWICWLNGQRKKAPTSEEIMELEARRERVRQNVALIKKEEEETKLKEGIKRKDVNTGKVGGPDLQSFIRQFPSPSQGENAGDVSDGIDEERRTSEEKVTPATESAEPTGSGTSYKPGTWQPPT